MLAALDKTVLFPALYFRFDKILVANEKVICSSCSDSKECQVRAICVDSYYKEYKECRLRDGAECTHDTDCVSFTCLHDTCVTETGKSCERDDECKGGKCLGLICKLDNMQSCVHDVDCASGLCFWGQCKEYKGKKCTNFLDCRSGVCLEDKTCL